MKSLSRENQADIIEAFFGGLGRAAVCNCGTSWTFLLPFFQFNFRIP